MNRLIDIWNRHCCILASIVFFLSVYSSAIAADNVPLNWPWKGITVFASAASPRDVLVLKKRLGLNSLRLELNVRLIAQRHNVKPDLAWTQSLDWADRMLNACRDAGLVGIIHISQFPIDPSLGMNQESSKFWNSEQQLAETIGLIGALGKRFNGRGNELAAYEILSEPLLRTGEKVGVPPTWSAFQIKVIQTIRRYDTRRYIIVNLPPGGSPQAYENFVAFKEPGLIYGAHMYLPHSFTHQGIAGRTLGYAYPGMVAWSYWDKTSLEQSLKQLRQFQLKFGVLVWIGEFSAVRWAPGAELYIEDLTSLFNKYGWGWEYFGYQEYHGWNPDYDAIYATDSQEDWTKHYVGESSARWKTLKEIFRK